MIWFQYALFPMPLHIVWFRLVFANLAFVAFAFFMCVVEPFQCIQSFIACFMYATWWYSKWDDRLRSDWTFPRTILTCRSLKNKKSVPKNTGWCNREMEMAPRGLYELYCSFTFCSLSYTSFSFSTVSFCLFQSCTPLHTSYMHSALLMQFT